MSKVLVLYSGNNKYRVSMCRGSLGQVMEHWNGIYKPKKNNLPHKDFTVDYFVRRDPNNIYIQEDIYISELKDPGKLKDSEVWLYYQDLDKQIAYKKFQVDIAYFVDPTHEEKLKMIKAKFLK